MKYLSMSDQQLILEYLDGNEMAVRCLIERHEERVRLTIRKYVKDINQADDIFQEVFIKVINTLRKGKYNHEGKFGQWVNRIAQNLCIDSFRKKKRRPTLQPTEEFDIFDVLGSPDDNIEEQTIKVQTYDKVKKLIDQLPPEQREVVILRHYADMSFKEIAGLTRVSINTALGRMRYALINIRKMVEEKEIALY